MLFLNYKLLKTWGSHKKWNKAEDIDVSGAVDMNIQYIDSVCVLDSVIFWEIHKASSLYVV